MDIKAYIKRQKYWISLAGKNGKGVREFFCAVGRTVKLVFKRTLSDDNSEQKLRERRAISENDAVVDNRIFFHTFQGNYTCNPKYISEKLHEIAPDAEIIWAKGKWSNGDFPDYAKTVEDETDVFKAMASSKVWVTNTPELFRKRFPKKDDQILIHTWHGSLGIKRFGKDVVDGSELANASDFSRDITDLLISNSEFETGVYRGTYWPENRIELWGHARNDILVNNDEEAKTKIRKKIREKYNIPEGRKLVLYAPTFRDSHMFKSYDLDLGRLKASLKERFGGEWECILRYHPSIRAEAFKYMTGNDNAYDVTDYPDIQELLIAADVGITDYSSWIYDYVLTGKPGFIYASDIDDYYNERSFYYSLYETPFSVATDNESLSENISRFDEASYREKVERFIKDKGCMEDGKASERAAGYINSILSKKEQVL